MPLRVKKLGILAGRGALPRQLAEACAANNQPIFIIDLEGAAADWVEHFPHLRVSLGQVGKLLAILKQEGCDSIAMAGGLTRPSLTKVRFDWKGVTFLPRVAPLFRQGDDGLLKGIAALFEEEGFKIYGPDAFLAAAIAEPGTLTDDAPDAKAQAEITIGLAILNALGPYDIGQGVVVTDGQCLAVEAAEGTAAMLARVATLRKNPGGVLIKTPKPGQDRRLDLPAIGPETVIAAHKAGLAGIAIAAGGVFILDRTETIDLARQKGIFIDSISIQIKS